MHNHWCWLHYIKSKQSAHCPLPGAMKTAEGNPIFRQNKSHKCLQRNKTRKKIPPLNAVTVRTLTQLCINFYQPASDVYNVIKCVIRQTDKPWWQPKKNKFRRHVEHTSHHISHSRAGVRSTERYRNGFLEDEVLPKVNCFENCFLLHLNGAKRLALNGTQFPEQIWECVCVFMAWTKETKLFTWK